MGQLIDGQWKTNLDLAINDEKGAFKRPDSIFRDWIENDRDAKFPAEPNRYHLYVSYACPWASRTLIMRKLKGLEDVISFSYVDAYLGEQGWTFGQGDEGSDDPHFGLDYLHQIYTKADNQYTGKVTVPVLWDLKKNTIVNNESSEIIRMMNSAFEDYASNKTDYYPEALQDEIDKINQFIYRNVNNGVYKCGFAKSQQAYDRALKNLFEALEDIEQRLSDRPYLCGETLTEADWRLFTTLIRFDAVYVCHFKTNLKRLIDFPNLSTYVRELYQYPGIKETVNFDHIKRHYFQSHTFINPTGIVAGGPTLDFE